jgi:hypothetical protein
MRADGDSVARTRKKTPSSRDPRGLDGAESGVPQGVQHAIRPERHT